MPISKTLSLVLVALAATTAFTPPARAGDAAAGEALFREGRALMNAGDFAAACPKLAESYSQDPATGTLLALAVCQEKAGQTASAWATYAQVATRAKKEGQTEREQAARERLSALQPTLSRLTISVDSATSALQGLEVKRDGKPIGPGAWGTAMPLDPGEHVVEATAPGKRAWQTKVTVAAEADAQTVQVPALEDEPAATAGAAAVDGGASTSTVAGPAPGSEGTPLRTIGLIVGGAGLVSLGVGGFFGLQAQSLNEDSKADGHCDAQNQCDATGGEKREDAKSAATVSTIAFVAGGVLTATGVTLFLVGGPKKQEAAAHVVATPAVGRNEAGMIIRGRF